MMFCHGGRPGSRVASSIMRSLAVQLPRRPYHCHTSYRLGSQACRHGMLGAPPLTSCHSYGYKRPLLLVCRELSGAAAAPDVSRLDEGVIVTNSCARRIKALQTKNRNPNLKLRLQVEGGGCSGFQYSFIMDQNPPNEDDRVFDKDGVQVIIDEGSLEFVKGATVDFVEEMMKSAFAVVSNPQSESACGCGSSFALKQFAANPAKD